MSKKMTFALAFCNRGFMPGELIYGAREDMIKAVTDAGYDYIAMDADLTRYGGIETRDEVFFMQNGSKNTKVSMMVLSSPCQSLQMRMVRSQHFRMQAFRS